MPIGTDPAEHPRLGVYWSFDEHSAVDFGADAVEGWTLLYHARIDIENVSESGTIWANSAGLQGDDENEVKFYKGAPIFVYDVTYPDGHVLEIRDWRRT